MSPVLVCAMMCSDICCPATFLLNNYKQVDQLLRDMPVAIAALESGKTPEECNYTAHLNTERAYLASRKKEPETDIIACKYIELLLVYEEATYVGFCALRSF